MLSHPHSSTLQAKIKNKGSESNYLNIQEEEEEEEGEEKREEKLLTMIISWHVTAATIALMNFRLRWQTI